MQRTQRTLFHLEFIVFWLEPDYIFIDLNYPIFFYFPISLSLIKENIKETIFCCLAIILIKVFSKKKNFFAEYHHYINIFIYLFNLFSVISNHSPCKDFSHDYIYDFKYL